MNDDVLGRYRAALEVIAARGCRHGNDRCLRVAADVAARPDETNPSYADAVRRGVHLCDACRARRALEGEG